MISWYSGYSKEAGAVWPGKEKIMRTVFTANAYLLHSELYKALKSEKKQSSIRMRSCEIREKRKTV